MPYKNKCDLYEAQRRYRKRQKEKITKLKRFASQPLTMDTVLELIERIKEL